MKKLTLREKLDALEACEVLIKYYEDYLNKRVREEITYNSDEIVGYDLTSSIREKLVKYKNLKNNLIVGLGNDIDLLQNNELDISPRLLS